MTQTWDSLRKEARRLETEIDSKLVEYSKMSASLSANSSQIQRTAPEGKTMHWDARRVNGKREW